MAFGSGAAEKTSLQSIEVKQQIKTGISAGRWCMSMRTRSTEPKNPAREQVSHIISSIH